MKASMKKMLILVVVGAISYNAMAADHPSYFRDTEYKSIPTTSSVDHSTVDQEEYAFIATAMNGLLPGSESENIVMHFVQNRAIPELARSSLSNYSDQIADMIKYFGSPAIYSNLSKQEKTAFCFARAVDAFFKGNMIDTSAFLLEARQLNLIHSLGFNFGPLGNSLYDTRFAIDARLATQEVVLTAEQERERLFFKLHISKLLGRTHDANIIQDPNVFLALAKMTQAERTIEKARNDICMPILFTLWLNM